MSTVNRETIRKTPIVYVLSYKIHIRSENSLSKHLIKYEIDSERTRKRNTSKKTKEYYKRLTECEKIYSVILLREDEDKGNKCMCTFIHRKQKYLIQI